MPSPEQMDRDIHDSCKAMHEHLMDIMLSHAKNGNYEKMNEDRKLLVQNYNNAMDSCVNLMAEIRRLK